MSAAHPTMTTPWSSATEKRIWLAGAALLALAMGLLMGLALWLLAPTAAAPMGVKDARAPRAAKMPDAAFLLAELERHMAAEGYPSPRLAAEGRLAFLGGRPLFPIGEARVDQRHAGAVRALTRALAFLGACYLEPIPGKKLPTPPPQGPQCLDGMGRLASLSLVIEGHADAVPIRRAGKGFADNAALSRARAAALRAQLAVMPSLAPFPFQWSEAAWGDAKPRYKPGENPRNRRVELRLIPQGGPASPGH